MELTADNYRQWLIELKRRIRQSQIKSAVKVNSELLHLYWEMGADIVRKQAESKWGDEFLKQLSNDLLYEFPQMKGFDRRNLYRIRQWYLFYSQTNRFVAQPVPQLEKQAVSPFEDTFFSVPWGHHILIIQRCKDINQAAFYLQQTVENGWSRTVLDWQIDSQLYERQGKAITNFTRTLPAPQGELAQQLTKDPYVIDIMGIRENMIEREIEAHLEANLSRYLLELGKGFTFYGRQVRLNVDGNDFYIDQLFYHVRLHCYVVVELKAVKFSPEHIGQLNFYVSAVDRMMRTDNDKPTIGLLICKDKSDVVAEYSLQGIESPIGISSMQLYNQLTADFKSSLPTIEEIENQLKNS